MPHPGNGNGWMIGRGKNELIRKKNYMKKVDMEKVHMEKVDIESY